MSKRDTMARLRAHAAEMRAALGDHLPELIKILRRLAERTDQQRAWDDLGALIFDRAPMGTGLPDAFVRSDRAAGVLDREEAALDWAAVAEEARALLATLDSSPAPPPTPEEILAAARHRLLREPALTRAEVLARGGDPDEAGLLRLSRPDGDEVLPAFQFGADGVPIPVVLEINRILDAERYRWAVADWWLTPSARLGAPPAALLGGGSEDRLLAAARSVRGRV